MSQHKNPKKCCGPREFVELLEQLMCNICHQHEASDHVSMKALDEEALLIKRDLTDYLLVNNIQAGVAVYGEDSAIHPNATYRPPQ